MKVRGLVLLVVLALSACATETSELEEPVGTKPDSADESLIEDSAVPEVESDLPADLPLPSNLQRVDVPEELIQAGYQEAYIFVGSAEAIYGDFVDALFNADWTVYMTAEQESPPVYEIDFADLSYAFEGNITIFENPAAIGIGEITDTLVVIRPGSMDD